MSTLCANTMEEYVKCALLLTLTRLQITICSPTCPEDESLRSSTDSDLEAFSHNSTDGSSGPLANQPSSSAVPLCNNGFADACPILPLNVSLIRANFRETRRTNTMTSQLPICNRPSELHASARCGCTICVQGLTESCK